MMPTQRHQNELASTYFVQDRSDERELQRLITQDEMLTSCMGGVLPEQSDPTRLREVLDIGCGPGGWAIQTALTYPEMSVTGIDISSAMVRFARHRAQTHGVQDRVTFAVMDALRMLEFPPNTFDLVNLRLGSSFVRAWDWPKLLSEMERVTRVGGVIRITEAAFITQSSSPSLLSLHQSLLDAMDRAGHLFAPRPEGLTVHIGPLLYKYIRITEVATRDFPLEFRAGTEAGQRFLQDVEHGFQTLRPFLEKWRSGPPIKGYDQVYAQALQEMQSPQFFAIWPLRTVWCEKE